jgi:beta-glucosidase
VQRRDELLGVMTAEEMMSVMMEKSVNRLHVPPSGHNEALHGVAWAGRATVFPCPLAMGATWDEKLVNEIGKAVAFEALAKHWSPEKSNALSFFAPNINIVRDVRWGRAQEVRKASLFSLFIDIDHFQYSSGQT